MLVTIADLKDTKSVSGAIGGRKSPKNVGFIEVVRKPRRLRLYSAQRPAGRATRRLTLVTTPAPRASVKPSINAGIW